MTIKLAYPTVASPSVLVTLGDVENLPLSRPRRLYQTAFDTDAGGQVIYDWGDETQVFSVDLYPLTEDEADDIEDFFRLAIGSGGVNGRVGEWQFLDSLGDTYDVRFAQDVIEAVRRNAYYAISLTLRVI